MVFVAGDQNHWCAIPRLENFTHEEQRCLAIPGVADECHLHQHHHLDPWVGTNPQRQSAERTMSCVQWVGTSPHRGSGELTVLCVQCVDSRPLVEVGGTNSIDVFQCL